MALHGVESLQPIEGQDSLGINWILGQVAHLEQGALQRQCTVLHKVQIIGEARDSARCIVDDALESRGSVLAGYFEGCDKLGDALVEVCEVNGLLRGDV
jgi:hypothetical protein